MKVGTSAIIGIYDEGVIEAIKTEHGGEPEYTGALLNACYNTIEDVKKLMSIGNIYILRQHLDTSKLIFDFLSDENKKKLYEKANTTVPLEVVDKYFCEKEKMYKYLSDISLKTGSGRSAIMTELKTAFLSFDYAYLYDVKNKRWVTFEWYGWECLIDYKVLAGRLRKAGVIKSRGEHLCSLTTCMGKMCQNDLEFRKTAHHDFINKAIEIFEAAAGQPIHKTKIKYPRLDMFPSIKTLEDQECENMCGEEIYISSDIEEAVEGLAYLKFIKSCTHDNTKYCLGYNLLKLYNLYVGEDRYCNVTIEYDDGEKLFSKGKRVSINIQCIRLLLIKEIKEF